MASYTKVPAKNKQGYKWICTLEGPPDGIDTKKVKKVTFEEVAWEWVKTYSKRKVKRGTVRIREKEIKILLRYFSKVIIDKITHRQPKRTQ